MAFTRTPWGPISTASDLVSWATAAFAASVAALARPIPLPAPVTMATRPVRSKGSVANDDLGLLGQDEDDVGRVHELGHVLVDQLVVVLLDRGPEVLDRREPLLGA